MEYSQKLLGLRIAKFRILNKLTQKELAEKCGLAQGYIAEIESGYGEYIRMHNLSIIADTLNVSIDELLIDSLVKYSDQQNEMPKLLLMKELLMTFSESHLKHFFKIVNLYKESK